MFNKSSKSFHRKIQINKIAIILALVLVIQNSLVAMAENASAKINISAEMPSYSTVENQYTGTNRQDIYVMKTYFVPVKLTNGTRFIIKTNSPDNIQAEFTFTAQTNQGIVNALSGEAGTNRGIAVFTREPIFFNGSWLKSDASSVANIISGSLDEKLNPNAIGMYVEFDNETGKNPIFLTNRGSKAILRSFKSGQSYIDVELENPVQGTISIEDIAGLYKATIICTLVKL